MKWRNSFILNFPNWSTNSSLVIQEILNICPRIRLESSWFPSILEILLRKCSPGIFLKNNCHCLYAAKLIHIGFLSWILNDTILRPLWKRYLDNDSEEEFHLDHLPDFGERHWINQLLLWVTENINCLSLERWR